MNSDKSPGASSVSFRTCQKGRAIPYPEGLWRGLKRENPWNTVDVYKFLLGMVDKLEAGSSPGPPGEPNIGPSSHFLCVSLTQDDLQLVANSALGPEI